MVSLLGPLVTQVSLAGRGNLALHRSLGWSSLVLAPAIVVVDGLTSITTLQTALYPPLVSAPFFLALVHVDVLAFEGLARVPARQNLGASIAGARGAGENRR